MVFNEQKNEPQQRNFDAFLVIFLNFYSIELYIVAFLSKPPEKSVHTLCKWLRIIVN